MNTFSTRIKVVTLAIATLTLALGAAWAAPGDAVDDKIERVEIKTRVHCQDDDCADLEHLGGKAIFIDEDGNTKVVGGDGEWNGADGVKIRHKILHGAHGGGFLGVQLTDLTPELRAHFGVPEGMGVMVSKVVAESPAELSGIQVGDIVTLADGQEISSGGELAQAIGSLEGGTDVTLEIWRDGRVQQITAAVEERERPYLAVMPRIHRMHDADGQKLERRIEIRCDDDAEECATEIGDFDFDFDFDCGDEECDVRVECTEGGCSCTVDGEDADCSRFPGLPGH